MITGSACDLYLLQAILKNLISVSCPTHFVLDSSEKELGVFCCLFCFVFVGVGGKGRGVGGFLFWIICVVLGFSGFFVLLCTYIFFLPPHTIPYFFEPSICYILILKTHTASSETEWELGRRGEDIIQFH